MKYIENWFHYYYTLNWFNNYKNAGLINPDSICFIEETSQIFTHNKLFGIPKQTFEQLVAKVEGINQTVAKHTEKLTEHGGEILLIKADIRDQIKPVLEDLSRMIATLGTNYETLKDSFDKFKESATQDIFNLKEVRVPFLENQVNDISGILSQTNTKLDNLSTDYDTFKDSKGSPNGLATLNEEGMIPSSQLPSYVDDVEVFPTFGDFPNKGVPDRIYVDGETNKVYRYTGGIENPYVEISKSLALGETSGSAYAGNKGKQNADNIANHKADYNNPHKVTKAQVGLSNVDNTSDANKPVSIATQQVLDTKADISDLSNVLAEEVLPPTTLEEVNTLTRETLKKDLFIDMWNKACSTYGKYNAATGYFELNGLTDITYEQALDIYNAPRITYPRIIGFNSINTRTLILLSYGSTSIDVNYSNTFRDSSYEVLKLCRGSYSLVGNLNTCFHNCIRLRIIENSLDIIRCVDFQLAFNNCIKLEEVRLLHLNKSINFKSSPLLSLESFQYMITNASNTSFITITVHADVYAKLEGDTSNAAVQALTPEERTKWQQLVEKATNKNIGFLLP